jgi:hypothetical protein
MPTTPLPIVALAALTPEHIGERGDSQYGGKVYEEYRAKRQQYLGMVVAVSDNERYESRGWDDGDIVYRRTVTVFDGVKASTFDSDIAYNGTGGRATAWAVDASVDVMAAYYKWYLSVALPTQALIVGVSAKAQYLKELDETSEQLAAIPALAKGQTYKVVRGRKVPHGTTGKVFWFGDKGWGMSVGLSITDRKDTHGRNLDVVFVALKNLEYVPDNAATVNVAAALASNVAARADADCVAARAATNWYKDQIAAWLKQTGYNAESVHERLIEVLTDKIKNANGVDDASAVALVALRSTAT